MRLYLVRHPKPLVAAGVCYGSSDIGVDERDTDNVLREVSAKLPKGLDIYSSPLQRCAGLARCLADAFDCVSPVFDERLAEMHFGDWELRAWDDIPRDEIDAWAGDLTMYRPGGGESVTMMAERVLAFYADVLLRRRDAIVVCHAGTIRMLLACQRNDVLGDIALVAARQSMEIGYGEVVVLDPMPPFSDKRKNIA
ncbi:MAG TPA: histidine phosphatase family protein [Candidimonas sp.]|nr:histidine phosphatase family protein [Candidimonas sp.]